MTRKQWAALTLSLLALGVGGTIAAVSIIDPFEVYHKATAFIPPITNGTQLYSNAGIAKNYAYDSVVIGSSMTENFRPSQLNRLFGGQFVKLCVNGGSSFDHKQMMELAFSTHDVRRVLYGIDLDALTYFYKTPNHETPNYLYDNDLLNDVAYWFNAGVLAKYIPQCLMTLGQSDPDQIDTMYRWSDLFTYGKDAVLPGFTFSTRRVEQRDAGEKPTLSYQFQMNVQHNFLPYIEQYPDTQFIFFFPPYSLLSWYQAYENGTLELDLHQKQALTEALLAYDNVQVYDFQARADWICNLDNYIDARHYSGAINDAMAEAMAAGENRITDAALIEANNDVIRSLVDQIVSAGEWPF